MINMTPYLIVYIRQLAFKQHLSMNISELYIQCINLLTLSPDFGS